MDVEWIEREICGGMIEAYDLAQLVRPALNWFYENRRILPWREGKNPYHIWVSEIMLQQTRVEAVKPYYERFLGELPDIASLAECPEDRLLKLWEGLGYYNRVRNMQRAAVEIMESWGGKMPEHYPDILTLPGIGPYTAGAIASIAFGEPVPAVDGNVLRILARAAEDDSDILKESTKRRFTEALSAVMPGKEPGDFNQSLMEIGALVCVPNGDPHCEKCPWKELCLALAHGRIGELPVKKRAKARRIEKKTVCIIRDGERILLHKRPPRGLLAGLYELPNLEGQADEEEAIAFARERGLMPLRVEPLPEAKHIFSHVEWHMTGYMIRVADMGEAESDRVENSAREESSGGKTAALSPDGYLLVEVEETRKHYPIPAAFEAYTRYVDLPIGMKKNQN